MGGNLQITSVKTPLLDINIKKIIFNYIVKSKMEKKCPRCETTKAFNEFYVRNIARDGRDTYCKDCRLKERRKATSLETTQDEFVKEGAERVLINLGYELYNPDNPVYRQFKERLERKGIHISTWE